MQRKQFLWMAIACITTTAIAQEAGIRPQVAVTITRDEYDNDPACGEGVVRGLDPKGDGFLAVKAGPGLHYKRIDKLFNGEEVFLCGYKGDWFAIVYTRTGQRCNVSKPWPKTLPYTGPCRSGWAHKRWIEVIAG